jgi:PAS domain S-box-containing protein
MNDAPRDTASETRAAKLEAILNTAVAAIVTIDKSGRIESVNPSTTTLFGYTADELIGENVRMLMPEPDADRHDSYLASYLDTGKKKIIGIGREVTGRRKNGSTFPVHLAVSEFHADGRRQFAGILTDLSSRRQAQDALKASERLLTQAQKMEAVGQLAGGIAHDFNNLLTVMLGNLELIEPHLPSEQHRTVLRRVQDAGASGADLTRRLLAFSRQLPLDPQIVRMNELVMRTSELLRRSIGEHINISAVLAPVLWDVRSDPAQIESTLTNLVINARDAMANGGRILIETRNVTVDADQIASGLDLARGEYVALVVSDTGSGIPPEIRVRIFEPFFTTKPKGRGTGLGLAMIYGFAKQSKGHVALYSEVGHGTTVTVYLPRASGVEHTPARTDPAHVQRSETGGTVLLVEDDAGVRTLNVERLSRLGYTVVEASTGAEALALIKGGLRPDLVFSDVVMPGGISGRELMEQVAAIAPSIPFLLTSGYSEEMMRAEGAPAVRLLQKPYRMAELVEAVRQAMQRHP